MLALAIWSLSGCGTRPDWVGVWQGERPREREPGMDPAIHQTLTRVKLTLREDGTFELIEAGMPREGDAAFGATETTLQARRFMGRPIERMGSSAEAMNQPMKLRWVGDGTIEYRDPAGFDTSPVVLRRVTAGG